MTCSASSSLQGSSCLKNVSTAPSKASRHAAVKHGGVWCSCFYAVGSLAWCCDCPPKLKVLSSSTLEGVTKENQQAAVKVAGTQQPESSLKMIVFHGLYPPQLVQPH